MAAPRLRVKIASEPWELEAVHRLNYRTFVEEIPQHTPNEERRLVDRLLARSVCFVCLDGRRLRGMVAVCGERPFSLDAKIENLDGHLPPHRRPCEVRLLAVEKDDRGGLVFTALMAAMLRHARKQGYDLGLLSGAQSQRSLYDHLGCVPIGPPLGTPTAPYQGMYLTWDRLSPALLGRDGERERTLDAKRAARPINLLPGPVAIHPTVAKALAAPPVSHRGAGFLAEVDSLRRELRRRTGAAHVEILLGSGTLANEAVAAQLSLLPGRGAILVNGEFGARLAAQAARWRLPFRTLAAGWGESLPLDELQRTLAADPEIRWVWAVHCETSTGVLNDLDALRSISRRHGVALCLDGISSLGNVPVDLSGVHLATGVSGKGLASFPGLALVFHADAIEPSPHLPHYLDLGSYSRAGGFPFTTSTNLVSALATSLARSARRDGFAARQRLAAWLRPRLESLGFSVMAPEPIAAPMVLTLVPPAGAGAVALGEALEEDGIWVSYRSAYLIERNLLQICLMGEHRRGELAELLEALAQGLSTLHPAPAIQAEVGPSTSESTAPIFCRLPT